MPEMLGIPLQVLTAARPRTMALGSAPALPTRDRMIGGLPR